MTELPDALNADGVSRDNLERIIPDIRELNKKGAA